MEATYGAEHLYLLQPLDGLGRVYARLGLAEQATRHLARAVAIADAQGFTHFHVARSLSLLAELAAGTGDLEQAHALRERARKLSPETAAGEPSED
jgi:tetratricopeptide (TPR) repeat protein